MISAFIGLLQEDAHKTFFFYIYILSILYHWLLNMDHRSWMLGKQPKGWWFKPNCVYRYLMCIVSLDKVLSLHRLVYPGEIELLHVKLCWQLICNRLGSHVGGVNDSHPLLTKGYKAGPLSLILFFKFCSMISYVIKLWYLVWNCCGTSFSENHSDN